MIRVAFVVRCLDIGDQTLRKLVMKRVHQMTAISFSYLSDSFARKMREGELGESVMSGEELQFVLCVMTLEFFRTCISQAVETYVKCLSYVKYMPPLTKVCFGS